MDSGFFLLIWRVGCAVWKAEGFNMVIRSLSDLPLTILSARAKVFKKSAVDAVLPLLVSRGFEFDVELIWRLVKAGYRIEEIPIQWQNMGDSLGRGRGYDKNARRSPPGSIPCENAIMPTTADDIKKEAFELFHAEMYTESLALCKQLMCKTRPGITM